MMPSGDHRPPINEATRKLAATALGETFGLQPDQFDLVTLKGDASSRSYHRATLAEGPVPSVVIMELAADPMSSDEFTEWSAPEYPFTLIQRYLLRGGLPVPEIHAANPENGWLVLQDLGDATLESVLAGTPRSEWSTWYERAIDLLAQWHRWWEESRDHNPVRERRFSRNLLTWELYHYQQWGLEERLGIELTDAQREALATGFSRIVDRLDALDPVLVHRDFQSRNLMVGDDGRATNLHLIDFQDALMGTPVYDAVALLCDSYVDIDPRLQISSLERLRSRAHPEIPREKFEETFHIQVIQRKLKDAGRFVFIDKVKGNPDFLVHIPQSLEYVRRSIEKLPWLSGLHTTLDELGGLDAP